MTCTTAWMPPSAPCIAICDGHFVHNMLKSRLNKPYLPRQFFMSTNYTRLSVRTATYDLTLQLPYNPSSISHIHSYPYTCGKERYEILHRMNIIPQIPDASEHSSAKRLPIKLCFVCNLALVRVSQIHLARLSFSATSRCRCSQQSAEEWNKHRNVQERERELTVADMPIA